MPGVAPAKVQHHAIKMSRVVKREITPYWDESSGWVLAIEEETGCDRLLHSLTPDHPDDYTMCPDVCDKGKHSVRFTVTYTRRSGKSGLAHWRSRGRAEFDNMEPVDVSFSVILSMLSTPTNPQGDGKVTSTPAAPRQMNVRSRTTISRV